MFVGVAAIAARGRGEPEGPSIPEAGYNTFGFDGSNDYINFGQDSSISLGDGNKTHSIWFKTSSSSTMMLFNQGDASGVLDYYDIYMQSGQIYVRAIGSANSNGRAYRTNLTYNDDTLHHLAVKWNGFGAYEIFIDGVSVAVTAAFTESVSSISNASKDLTVGNRLDTSSLFFDGDLTQCILLGVNATSQQISDLYNNGKIPYYESLPSSVTDDVIMACEMSSRDSTLNDLSTNTNNGTANGGVTSDGSLQTFSSYGF